MAKIKKVLFALIIASNALLLLPAILQAECTGLSLSTSGRGFYINLTSDSTQKILAFETSADDSRHVATSVLRESNGMQSSETFALLPNTSNYVNAKKWIWDAAAGKFISKRVYDGFLGYSYDEPIETRLFHLEHMWFKTQNDNFDIVLFRNYHPDSVYEFKLTALVTYDQSGRLISIDQECVEELPSSSSVESYYEDVYGVEIKQSPEASPDIQYHALCVSPAGVVANNNWQCTPPVVEVPKTEPPKLQPPSEDKLSSSAKKYVNSAISYLTRAKDSKNKKTKIKHAQTANKQFLKALSATKKTNNKYKSLSSYTNRVKSLATSSNPSTSSIKNIISALKKLL